MATVDAASLIAAASVRATVGLNAPGCAFLVRSGPDLWAEASFGWARAPWDDGPAPMTIDTAVHIASMSKPICATALVALIEDWNWLFVGLAQLPPAPQLPPLFPFLPVPRITVPDVLVPAFTDRGIAGQLCARGVAQRLAQGWGPLLISFAGGRSDLVPGNPGPTPPGYVGLMDRVTLLQRQLDPAAPFLPLLADRVAQAASAYSVPSHIGAGVAAVTLEQLAQHTSPMPDGVPDAAFPGGSHDPYVHETSDGSRATFNLWLYMALYLAQDANQAPRYRNDEYTTLGAVIEACTEMSYADWVIQRLFFDDRFSRIRRQPVGDSARYYPAPSTGPRGAPVGYGAGAVHPDYHDWSAAGGWYVTARQLTDWMYTLYAGASVATPTGLKALLSATGRDWLFGTKKLFSGGTDDNLGGGVVSHRHNGGTSVAGGATNGKLSVIVGPGTGVHAAFLLVNGAVGADALFDPAIAALQPSF